MANRIIYDQLSIVHCMDFLNSVLQNSIAKCKNKTFQAKELARTMRKLNNKLLNSFLKDAETVSIECEAEIILLFDNFVWLAPCCEDCADILDTYNFCHVIGILLCKYYYWYFTEEFDPDTAAQNLPEIFPKIQALHLFKDNISTMNMDKLMLVLACVQQYWPKIVKENWASTSWLCFLLMSRMGALNIFHLKHENVQKQKHVDVVKSRPEFCKPKKKSVRSFVSTMLVFLRSLCFEKKKQMIKASTLHRHETDTYLRVQCYDERIRQQLNIHPEIHRNIVKLKSLRGVSKMGENTESLHGLDLWKHICSRLPENSIGLPPRKINAELEELMRFCCVFLDASSFFQEGIVLTECASVLEAALKFFYVVPGMETFKKTSILLDIFPGQRLNYAFDYKYFDTGQLSQVLFLHSPLHEQKKPPSSVDEWDRKNPMGPFSAFLQLDPTVETWYDCSEDPLGLLKHEEHITRPAQHNKLGSQKETDLKKTKRFAFIINSVDIYLIDRQTCEIFYCNDSPEHRKHQTLYLLCLYIYLNHNTKEIVKVALNSFKVSVTDIRAEV